MTDLKNPGSTARCYSPQTYSYRTEQTYLHWVYRFIIFHNKRHPKEMGAPEIEAFLTHLVVRQLVAASTKNQALSALVFFYRHVLRQDIGGEINAVRAKTSRYLPSVLTHEEAIAVLEQLSSTYQLVAKILYSSGLRLSEVLQLRVKDLDFAQQQIIVLTVDKTANYWQSIFCFSSSKSRKISASFSSSLFIFCFK